MFFISCAKKDKEPSSEQKPPSCDDKLEAFKTCLLSQFFSVTCPALTDQKNIALKQLCKKHSLTSDLEKECPQTAKDLQKTISEQKLNKCKTQTEVKQE